MIRSVVFAGLLLICAGSLSAADGEDKDDDGGGSKGAPLNAAAMEAARAAAVMTRDPVHDPVDARAAEPRLFVFEFPQTVASHPVRVHVWERGGDFGQAWATSPARGGYGMPVWAQNAEHYGCREARLLLKGNAVSGGIWVGGVGTFFQVSGQVNGKTLGGSLQMGPGPAGATTKGSFNGRVLSMDEWRTQVPAIAAGADWPNYRGPYGSGVGVSAKKPLVDLPDQARVLWKSEALILRGYKEDVDASSPEGSPAFGWDGHAGHASPILGEGLVFMAFHIGNPSEWYERGLTTYLVPDRGPPESAVVPEAMWKKAFGKKSDHIVVAIDAQTGQTRWRRILENDGHNLGASANGRKGGRESKAASHLTPAYGLGMVFVKGTTASLTALDAKTGAVVWSVPGLTGFKSPSHVTNCDAVAYADGVVATCRGPLIAYDAKTGKEMWKLAGHVGKRNTALTWACKGKEYFLTPSRALLEPRTGKILWQAEAEGGGLGGVIVADEQWMVYSDDKGINGYRISPQKVEKLWTVTDLIAPRQINAIIWDGKLAIRAMSVSSKTDNNLATYAFDMATGKNLNGDQPARGTKSFSGMTAGDGRILNGNAAQIYYQDISGPMAADLPAGAQQGTPFRGVPECTPIYADGRMIYRTWDGIVCVDLRSL